MNKHLGRIIKSARKDRRATQATLALHTKIPRERVSKIESGKMQPTGAEIAAISIYLEDLNIIRAYWQNSQLHDATSYICGRMGVKVTSDMEITARQFSADIIARAKRIDKMIQGIPQGEEQNRQEHIMLAGQEAFMIGNLSTALRLLLCDIK